MIKEQHHINELIKIMEEAGESPHFIIGYLSSMIDASAKGYTIKGFTIQNEIDFGIKFYTDKAMLAGRMATLQKVCNATPEEELYA